MAKAKNTFLKSKMNKDLDARILDKNEYRDAVNVQVNKSEGDEVGSLENVLGNTKAADVSVHTGANNLTCIGQAVDDSTSTAYLFYTNHGGSIDNYSPSAENFIISFNSSTNTLTTLVEGAFLNFSTKNPIYGVNVLENLLFWTDNRNQPRKINLQKASTITGYYITEDQISVAKYNPHKSIELFSESALSPGDYESTMKDVSSFYLPNGGKGIIKNDVTAGDTQVNLSTLEGDIVVPGPYGATGASVSYTTSTNPPSIVEVAGVTVSSFTYNDSTSAWEVTVTGGTLPDLDDITQSIVFNANPYYNKDYAGDPTYLEDKFVRFGYRFKFDDDEYSLFSTFTQSTFIPKQDGYFMYVKKDEADNVQDVNDQDAAYRSSIVSFMENKVNNIELRIPLPFDNYELQDKLKVKSLEILYKESDEPSVKVVDSIDINTIFNAAATCQAAAATTTTNLTVDNVKGGINVGDRITGFGILGSSVVTVDDYEPDNPDENPSTSGTITLSSAQTIAEDTVLTIGETDYYVYNYESKKPFKTLPEKDLIRVYDKIPVRAFAQEVSGNRVIYGNFQNKHTAPDHLNYNVAVTEKNEFSLNEVTVDADAIPSGSTTITFTNYNPKGGSTIQIGYIVICPGIPEGTLVTSVTTGGGNTGTITIDNATTANINLGQVIIIEPGGDTKNTSSVIEYPNNSVKTNRNYQVGVVLSDRYGRQSGVILSDNKDLIIVDGNKFIGSTVYSPYINSSTQPDEWRGNSIKMLFNETIATQKNLSIGLPGVYNGDPTSGDYNPLGWYTFKVVVKQTEQEYYNVYLPGIMAAYPNDTTLEVGKTSHIALISDNINKVPRDLAEVGPDQEQFRSSVKLYGRVENSDVEVSETLTNIGDSNLQYYPDRTFDFASTVATNIDLFDYNPQNPPAPNYFPQFYSVESNPYIARINTAKKIGQVADVNFTAVSGIIAVTTTTDTLKLTSVSGDSADIEIGDKVVGPGFPDDLVVSGSGFTTGGFVREGTVGGTGFTGTTFELSAYGSGTGTVVPGLIVETTTGVPEGTVVLNISGTFPNFEVEVNNVVQVTGGQSLNFNEADSLVVSIAVPVTLGDSINVYSATTPGIQYLAVYETEPVQSLLDIFWETSTTGFIQDINDVIINENEGGSGAAGLSNWNDNPFNESLRSGEDCLQAPIYLVDNFGAAIPSGDIDVPLSLDSVFDANGINVQTEYTALGFANPVFSFEETSPGSYEYMLKTAPGFVAEIYYGTDEGARNFTLTFSAVVNDLPITITQNLSLGNTQPHIPTSSGNSSGSRVLKDQTSVTTILVYTGGQNIQAGWDVTTLDLSYPLPAGLQTAGTAFTPPGNPLTAFGVVNAVSNSNTFVVYDWLDPIINPNYLLYRQTSNVYGSVPSGTYIVSKQADTPVAGQITVTVSKNITVPAFTSNSSALLQTGAPGQLEVSAAVTVGEGQLLNVVDSSEIWDDCPLAPFYPGGTNVRHVGELKAVNGAGWRSTDTISNAKRAEDLTFTKISEVRGAGTPGEETLSPGYFALENPGYAFFGSAAKIDLVNTGYQDANMPSDVYTITYEVSDPGDSVQCQAIVNTGLVICELQEWTLEGYYRNCSGNISTGVSYEGRFIFVKVCDPNGGLIGGTNVNGWYAWLSGNQGGEFSSWQNLVSSNGSSNIIINPTGGTGTGNMATQGWTAKFLDTATLKNVIATNQTIIGGCLVYGGNPDSYTWTLTAGTGTSVPLVPSTSNYLFTTT
jgi:hypothetical protein